MEIKVVTGANLGDEGKGLVSYCLARDAAERNHKILTVLFNGGAQRAHTAGGKVFHCLGTGSLMGSDTFYHEKFLLDPITLYITGETPIIDPRCRVILPCDVNRNRQKELARGENKHGSCGMGIFEASKRSAQEENCVRAESLQNTWNLYYKVKYMPTDGVPEDELYNMDIWMRAVDWVLRNCPMKKLEDVIMNYDTVIFEGGQGLLLDQSLIKLTPHLTPSSVGSYNIAGLINGLNCTTDVYYVSRPYMTRHGRGPMENECGKADINADIVDKTNQPNPWQDSLRFGFLDQFTLANRVQRDFVNYTNANAHLVFTQLNYTNGTIAADFDKREDIKKPYFITDIYGSYKEDEMSKLFI